MNRQTGMRIGVGLLAGGFLLAGSGCAMFRSKVGEVDVNEPTHMSANYDFTDMRTIAQYITERFVKSPFLTGQPQAPVMMIAGIQNRTSRYEDTKNLSDYMRSLIFERAPGKVRFVNETRRDDLLKEQGYQAANVTPDLQTKIGRQLGAKYMISGSITEMESEQMREVRVSKTEIKYYKLTFEVTDLETGELVYTDYKEFARSARKPIIGW